MLLYLLLFFFAQALALNQVNDDYFVDDPSRQPSDWEDFFWREPLLELRDIFIGVCSRFSVNPSLVLALMEMRSGLITRTSVTALTKPFGEMSYQTGFLNQMDDVLPKLASDYYDILEQQTLEFTTKHSLTVQKTAATQALERLFAAAGEWPEEQLGKLFETHETLFDRPLATPEHLAFYSARVMRQSGRPPMQMPWQLREGGWSSGGTHANNGRSGEFSALDFARRPWPSWGGRMDPVHAAHDGVVERVTSCGLRITHSSGWATYYYHLDQVAVRNGQTVRRNDRLAVYANNHAQAICNGGSSTGPHLHFALLNRGAYVSLQDVRLSNYQVNTGNDHYDRNCERFFYINHNDGGARVCAGRDLTAHPPSDSDTPPPPPPPTTSGAYERRPNGRDSCSSGYSRMTQEQCRAMAETGFATGSSRSWGGAYSDPGYPRGCYLWLDDNHIYFNTATSGTAGESRSAPICIHNNAYEQRARSASGCSSNYKRMTQRECSSMANMGFVGTGSFGYAAADSNYPRGCYLYSDNVVYFNTASSGRGRSSSSPICILA